MAQLTISDESAALLRELHEGLDATFNPARPAVPTEAQIVENAIVRVHRGFFGLLPENGGPEEPTKPFSKWASDRGAEVLLRQVDPKRFRLAQPFRYNDGTHAFDVPEEDVTDLASTPRFLTWLIPRYGRHTLAALLHDHLQRCDDVTSEEADTIFRDSMGDNGVPLSRRWLMWSAVALRTEWNRGGLFKIRALLWAILFGAIGLALWPVFVVILVTSFTWGTLGLLALGVVAAYALAVVLSFVWGRLWRLGAVGGFALLFFTLQILAVVIALGAYFAIEWTTEHLFVRGTKRNPVLTRNLSPARPGGLAAR